MGITPKFWNLNHHHETKSLYSQVNSGPSLCLKWHWKQQLGQQQQQQQSLQKQQSQEQCRTVLEQGTMWRYIGLRQSKSQDCPLVARGGIPGFQWCKEAFQAQGASNCLGLWLVRFLLRDWLVSCQGQEGLRFWSQTVFLSLILSTILTLILVPRKYLWYVLNLET